jgi:hypothetical protein
MNIDLAVAVAIGALAVSAISPAVFLILQRRARKKDSGERLALEDTHRQEIAAEAVKLAQQRLLTASMEQELSASQHAIRVIQAAIKLKLDTGVLVLPETNAALLALQEQAHALEVELFERKASHG